MQLEGVPRLPIIRSLQHPSAQRVPSAMAGVAQAVLSWNKRRAFPDRFAIAVGFAVWDTCSPMGSVLPALLLCFSACSCAKASSVPVGFSPFSFGFNTPGIQWFRSANAGLFMHFAPVSQVPLAHASLSLCSGVRSYPGRYTVHRFRARSKAPLVRMSKSTPQSSCVRIVQHTSHWQTRSTQVALTQTPSPTQPRPRGSNT